MKYSGIDIFISLKHILQNVFCGLGLKKTENSVESGEQKPLVEFQNIIWQPITLSHFSSNKQQALSRMQGNAFPYF